MDHMLAQKLVRHELGMYYYTQLHNYYKVYEIAIPDHM